MKGLPIFFEYNKNTPDSGFEAIQDFFISWTLRCAADEFSSVDYKVHNYSKRILFQLIYKNPDLNFKVLEVVTKRQFKYIDLLVEVVVNEGLANKKYLLNIENKWYTSISDTQLKNYKNIIEKNYSNDFVVRDIVLYPDWIKVKENEETAKKSDYEIITVEGLKDVISGFQLTNNYLFDEYWFKFYNL